MFKLSSWIARSARQAGGAVARLTFALCGLALVASASAQTVQFTGAAYQVDENDGSIRISVSRLGAKNKAFSVTFTASGGPGTTGAVNGQHFVARTGLLTFGTNEMQKTFDIVILDNGETNVTRVINLQLSNPTAGVTLGTPNFARINIIDDETGATGLGAGAFEFSTALYSGTDSEGLDGILDEDGNMGTYRRLNTDPEGIIVTVTRKNGSRGRVLVDLNTFNTELSNPNVYFPVSTTLDFADYQMSASVVIPTQKYPLGSFLTDVLLNQTCIVVDTNGVYVPSDDPFCAGFTPFPFNVFQTNINNFLFYRFETRNGLYGSILGYTSMVGFATSPAFTMGLQLSNPRAHTNEDARVVQPTLGTRNSADLRIYIVDNWKDTDGAISANFGFGFSFERINSYIDEAGNMRVQFFVNRDATLSQGAALVRYWVNNSRSAAAAGDSNFKSFPLHPSSDYAHPNADYLPPGSTEWWNARAILENDNRLRKDNDEDATVNWGNNNFAPQPTTIIINRDDLVEFQEDFVIQLYLRVGDPGFIQPGVGVATVSIFPDNIGGVQVNTNANFPNLPIGVTGGEVTAGAGDREYNLHFSNQTDPPNNLKPGANADVLAAALTPDGKLVIGGDFTAVNTHDRVRVARLHATGQIDRGFEVGENSGANGAVTAVAVQPDGKVIIGGLFSSYRGILQNGIARINTDGTVDNTFTAGQGANGPVRAITLLPDGKILVGGEFTTFNNTNKNYLVRLTKDGALDPAFNTRGGPNGFVYSIAVDGSKPVIIEQNTTLVDRQGDRADLYDTGSSQGTIIVEFDFGGTADTLEVLKDGQLLQGTGLITGAGQLTIPYGPGGSSYITVRMNRDRFPGTSNYPHDWMYRLTILPNNDDRPVIGGAFTTVDGVSRNRVARLNVLDGSLDTSFSPGFGIEDGDVFAVAKHGNKTFVGGAFTSVDRNPRGRIVGLNENGSVDLTFDPAEGFNDIVYALAMHASGRVMAGGRFTEFNTSRRVGMARLRWNGKLDTTFMDTAYNQFAGVPAVHSSDPVNFIRAMTYNRLTNSYNINVAVVDTNGVTNVQVRTFTRYLDHLYVGGHFQNIGGNARTRAAMLPRQNFSRVMAHATPGPGLLELAQDTYTSDENSGNIFIVANREDGHLGGVTAAFSASNLDQGPGAATDISDFSASLTTASIAWARPNDTRQRSEAYRGPNSLEFLSSVQDPGNNFPQRSVSVTVPIIDDTEKEGNEQLQLNLKSKQEFINLGGENIPVWPALGRSKARLTIIDNDFSPGVIGFAQDQYTTNEYGNLGVNNNFAIITLTRTNGSVGEVSVSYRTITVGSTATPWDSVQRKGDYDPRTLGQVSFASGQTNAQFTILLHDDTDAELDETVLLELIAASPSGVTIGRRTAVLNLIDNDFAPGRVSFQKPVFPVGEGDGRANIVVRRTGGTQGSAEVTVSTFDMDAQSGRDYVGVTNVLLRWPTGDSTDRIVPVSILDANLVDGLRSFFVELSNPRINGTNNNNLLGNQTSATVEIADNDAFGNLRFSQPLYAVDENGTNATITVIRTGGISGELTVLYSATPELAIPGDDFAPTSGSFTFTNGQSSASFDISIIDDFIVDGTKTVTLQLSSQTNLTGLGPVPGALGSPAVATLNIIDNELENIPAGSLDASFLAEGADRFIYSLAQQADGRLMVGGDFTSMNSVLRNRLARLNTDGTLDSTFFAGDGPNGSVRALQIQDDGRILIAGAFTTIAGTTRNYFGRLVADGGIDPTFDPGAGANNPVYAMILQPDGRILLGGDFSLIGPVGRNGVARLSANGVLDETFNPGTGAAASGAFTVYAIAQQLDGKVLLGGEFTSFNNVPANHLVRLNINGSVDTNFNMSIGPNGSVRALAVQPDGRILVGGLFTSVKGVTANHLVRIEQNGAVDQTFNAGPLGPNIDESKRGANGPVASIALQIDGKIVLGGDFTEYNGVTRRGLTRIISSGANDPTINFGTGANGSVQTVLIQSDRRIILAGGFTEYDGQQRLRLARINGGSIRGSGRLEFDRSSYTVSETGTEATITVRRVGGTAGTVTVQARTEADPNATSENAAVGGNPLAPGLDYLSSTNLLTFPEGETVRSFKIPVRDDAVVESDKIFQVALFNALPGAGAEIPGFGDQPTARVVITSDDSEISFTLVNFSVGESVPSGAAPIIIQRTGAVAVPVSVTFFTTDGTATNGLDYTSVSNVVTFAVGENQRSVAIPILRDAIVEGNEFINLTLINPTAGGTLRGGVQTSRLTIVDDDFAAGEIRFARTTYSVTEPGGTNKIFAHIEVIRTNGITGVVTVEYDSAPVTATPNVDYTPVSGILTFRDTIDRQFIDIEIFPDQGEVEPNEVINLILRNVGGGATLGLTNATLTIVDNDLGSGSVDGSFNPGFGANGAIRALELDYDRRFLIGGDFTAFNGDGTRQRVARLLESGSIDASFTNKNRPNNNVAALALYPPDDRRIVLGGNFSQINTVQEIRIARLLPDGLLDTNFFLPLGLNGEASAVAIQTVQPGDRRVLVGGVFEGGAALNHILRLTASGRVDTEFNAGSGPDKTVNVITVQPNDGKVLIGGEFNSVAGLQSGRIARLNLNGSVDTTFQVGLGFTRLDGRPAVIYDILVLDPDRILVGGDFTAYKNVPRAGVAMLNHLGVLQTFGTNLVEVNGPVRTLAAQTTTFNPDDKIIFGGDFTSIRYIDFVTNAVTRVAGWETLEFSVGRVARMKPTGSIDTGFNVGNGANASVYSILVEPWDGRPVVAGAFTEFNNNTNYSGIVRLNNDERFRVTTPPTGVQIGIPSVSASAFQLSFPTENGVSYRIRSTLDFQSWTDVDGETIVGDGGIKMKTIPIPATGYRFYRVERL